MFAKLKFAYTFAEASLVSGVTEPQLQKLAKSGELDSFRVGNRELILRPSLELFCYRKALARPLDVCRHG